MQDLILAVSYWLHSVAAVIWIGGITFILFIAIPASRQVLGTEAGRLMGEISKRFTPLANYCIILLVITGILMTGLNKQFSGVETFKNNWTLILAVKHIFVLGMVAMAGTIEFTINPKIREVFSKFSPDAQPQEELVNKFFGLRAKRKKLCKICFVFAILILVISPVLRFY